MKESGYIPCIGRIERETISPLFLSFFLYIVVNSLAKRGKLKGEQKKLAHSFSYSSMRREDNHYYRKGFLSFRIGPETPKIGELLKTTCSEEDETEGGDVQLDEEEARKRRLVIPNIIIIKRRERLFIPLET